MKKKYCRYSKHMFDSLGYRETFNGHYGSISEADYARDQKLIKGNFANIIDLLYDSTDMSLDSAVSKMVSENAPEDVRNFVRNFLMQPVQPLQAAPNDEVAFEMIIPRSAQTSAELAPYLENMRQIVMDARAAQTQPADNGTD